MVKYLNPKADLTFKKVFGEHPNLVISLLNALLPLKDDERVVSIEYWPTEKIPRRTQAEKDSIVDVCCRDNKKREFIVEMQMTWTDAFKKRVLLNASKAYIAQSEVGEDYAALQPVYALNFVNAPMNIGSEGYYHYYQLVHHESTNEVIDGLQLVFIELPKFFAAKAAEAEQKLLSFSERKMHVLWLRFLTEINEKTQEAPAEMLENEEVSQALKIVEMAAYTPAEMRAYDKFWDNVSVQKTLDNEYKRKSAELEQIKKEIRQKQIEITEEKNRAEQERNRAEQERNRAEQEKNRAEQAESQLLEMKQEKMNLAKKMKADGLSAEIIQKYSGLTPEEISAL